MPIFPTFALPARFPATQHAPRAVRKAFSHISLLGTCAAAVFTTAALLVLFAPGCSRSSTPATPAKADESKSAPPKAAENPVPAPAAAPAQNAPTAQPAAPVAPIAIDNTEKLVQVRLTTNMGDIILELNREKAPISVANFLKYVDKGFYSGTTFHRVIPGFMIQGGGFTADMVEKPTDPPIKNEWQNGLKNEHYTIAMARTNVADSATSQFYINVTNNPALDKVSGGGAAYAVFGKVVSGQDVVDKIRVAKTGFKGGMPDVPVDAVIITKAAREPRK